MDRSDHQLLLDTVAGDLAAFGKLVDRHKDKVYGLAFKMFADESIAQEIAQDTFLRIYKSASKYRGEAVFSTYLYRVAVNCCYTRLKRKRVEDGRTESLATAEGVPGPGDPAHQTERDEVGRITRRLVAELPPDYASVIALYHFEQLSYEEISDALRIPIGTVKTRLHRGRALLRRRIVKAGLLQELAGHEV